MNLVPKKWAEFQHYKDRSPPWIKLHRELLNNRDFMCLPLASKALAPLLWLLASESKDGTFDADLDELNFRLRIDKKDLVEGLKPLIDKGFFIDASGVLADCLRDAIPETEGERESEKRQNTAPSGAARFEDFWKAWPKNERKQDKAKCLAKWKAEKLDKLADTILADIGVKVQTQKWQQGYIEAPLVYLNGKRWLDEVQPEQPRLAQDVARVTVPGRSEPDPVLDEIKAHRGAPIPPEIRERMKALTKPVSANE
jgi:hypothetical protein